MKEKPLNIHTLPTYGGIDVFSHIWEPSHVDSYELYYLTYIYTMFVPICVYDSSVQKVKYDPVKFSGVFPEHILI